MKRRGQKPRERGPGGVWQGIGQAPHQMAQSHGTALGMLEGSQFAGQEQCLQQGSQIPTKYLQSQNSATLLDC